MKYVENHSSAHDNVRILDSMDFNGARVAGGDPHEIIGEVSIVYRSKHNGKAVFTKTIRRNDLLVTGAVFITEKINAMRSSYIPTPLDVKHGIHAMDDQFDLEGSTLHMIDAGTLPYERICGIMVGREGCGETNNQVHRVYRTDTEVPGVVPFRTINLSDGQEDLTGDERKLYILRHEETINGKDCICYYGKRFIVDREINVQWEDGTVVDASTLVRGSDRGKLVRTFTKFTTMLSSKDIREYCKISEGSTVRSVVNSVGLITGFPVDPSNNSILTPAQEALYTEPYEFGFVRGMTTLNTEDYPLKDKESTMKITYRLFVV